MPSTESAHGESPRRFYGAGTSMSRLRPKLLPAASARPDSTARAGTAAAASGTARSGRALDAALRRGRLRGNGVGQRRLCRRARGRLHAVHDRHHRPRPGRARRDRRAGRGRSARPGQAARQAGLAARAALDLVSAHHRHLADGVAGDGAGDVHRTRRAGRPTWRAGRSASKPGSPANARDDCASTSSCAAGDELLADDTLSVVSGEVHRRIALSDPGIDDSRNELLWSPHAPDPDRRRGRAVGPARRAARPRDVATPRCARSTCRATASCSTAGPICCAWCSTRATGRTPA